MTPETTPSPADYLPRAPDPILGELWQVKREINREAGYRIETLARMAREAAERIREKWRETSGSTGAAPSNPKQ